MTGFSHSPGVQSARSTIAVSAGTYLRALQSQVSESTFYSHQNTLRKFVSWHREQRSSGSFPTLVGEFTEYILEDAGLAPDTAVGHVHTLLNFGAYHTGTSPDILRMPIASIIHDVSCCESTLERLREKLRIDPGPAIRNSVYCLIRYLRERDYGTRTHLFAALILETASRPKQVRLVDRSDLTHSNLIAVGLSDTHLVTACGLHETRTVSLSAEVSSLLETYLEHERTSPREGNSDSLLTTRHGRASKATLRRSVKQASGAANNYAPEYPDFNQQDTVGESDLETVVPSDIWRVALNEVTPQE